VDLDRAADERHVFRSEIIKRALRCYVEQNPDNIQALDEVGSRSIGTVNSLHKTEKT
jgi:metal-responsive CopG/Arc/MetJ family transcriptional regulator